MAEISGQIIAVLPTRSGTSAKGTAWSSQTAVIETREQYPKKVAFDVFGADDEEIEMPGITPLLVDAEAEEILEPFGDVDYEEDLENVAESESASMTPWREDSK